MTKFNPVGSCYTNEFSTTELSEIPENEERDPLTGTILSAAIEVHRALGPGLLESAYVNCLIYEFMLRGLKVEHEKPLPVFYKDVMLDCGYRLDLRERLDEVNPQDIRPAFTTVFSALQRGKELEKFEFLDGKYLLLIRSRIKATTLSTTLDTDIKI